MTSTISSSLANSYDRHGDALSPLHGASPLTLVSAIVTAADESTRECLLFTFEDRTPTAATPFFCTLFQPPPASSPSLVSFFNAQHARRSQDSTNSIPASKRSSLNVENERTAVSSSLLAVEIVQSFYIDLKHTFVFDLLCCLRDGNCYVARFTLLHNPSTNTNTNTNTNRHNSMSLSSTSSTINASKTAQFHSLFRLPLLDLLSTSPAGDGPVTSSYRQQEMIQNVAIALHPWASAEKKKLPVKQAKRASTDGDVPKIKVRIAIPFFVEAILYVELELQMDLNKLDISAHPIYRTAAVGSFPFLLNQDSDYTSYGANYYTKKLFFLPHHFDFYEKHPLLVILHQYQMVGQAQRAGATTGASNNGNNSYVPPRDVVNVCMLEEQRRAKTTTTTATQGKDSVGSTCEVITGILSEGPFSLRELALSHASFLFTAETAPAASTAASTAANNNGTGASSYRWESEGEDLIGIFTRDPFECFPSSPLCVGHTSTASTTTSNGGGAEAETAGGALVWAGSAAPRGSRRDAYSFVLYNGEGEVAKAVLGGPIVDAITLYHSPHSAKSETMLLGAVLVEVYDTPTGGMTNTTMTNNNNENAAKTHFVLLEVLLTRTANGGGTTAPSGGGFQVAAAMEKEQKKKGYTVAIRSTPLHLDVEKKEATPSLSTVRTYASGMYRGESESEQKSLYWLSRMVTVEAKQLGNRLFHDLWYITALASTTTTTTTSKTANSSPTLYRGTQTPWTALPDLRHAALSRAISQRAARRPQPQHHNLWATLSASPPIHVGALQVVWSAAPYTHTTLTATTVTTILLLRNGWFCARVKDPRGGVGGQDVTLTFVSQLPPLETVLAKLSATLGGALLPAWMREALLLLLLSEPEDVQAVVLPFPAPNNNGEEGRETPDIRWLACCSVQQYLVLFDVMRAEVLHMARVTNPQANTMSSGGGEQHYDGFVPFRLAPVKQNDMTAGDSSFSLFLLSGVQFQRRKGSGEGGADATTAAVSLMEERACDVAAVYVLFQVPMIHFNRPAAPSALYVPAPEEIPPPFVCVCVHDVTSVVFRPLSDKMYVDCFRVRPFWFQLGHGKSNNGSSSFAFLRASMDRVECMCAASRSSLQSNSYTKDLPFSEQIEYLSFVTESASPQKEVLSIARLLSAGGPEKNVSGYISYMEQMCTLPSQALWTTTLFVISVVTTEKVETVNTRTSFLLSCTYADEQANTKVGPPQLQWRAFPLPAPSLYVTELRATPEWAVVSPAATEELHFTILYENTNAQERDTSTTKTASGTRGGHCWGQGALTVRPKELAKVVPSAPATAATEYVQYMATTTFASIKL